MKKRFLLALFLCVLLCGCTPIQDMTIEEVIDNGTSRTVAVYNKYRKGYKYNLPKGLEVTNFIDYNETISSRDYTYYLYVDGVSYFNKIIETYEVNDVSYISMPISYQDKFGYLEVNKLVNGKYFIELMYNYAKIEVIVNKDDINVAVANILSILTSVKFDDEILKSLLDEEVSQFRESEFNIFETATTVDSDYIQAIDADIYREESVHDSDLIK
ncbi:MAG: hypothetical protein ACI4WW_02280 [Candidatus Coprovivens sp.]